jgi:hypothetical protein
MKRLASLGFAIVFAAAIGVVAAAQDQQKSNNVETTNCTYNFGGGAFSWCLSESGNLMSLQSPSGFEHIRIGAFVEGYMLCTPTGNYSDYGFPSGTWSSPVLISSSSKGATIDRFAGAGNLYKLSQKWSADKTETDLTVQMTVTNNTVASTISLVRHVDTDVDNNTSNTFDRSVFGGWARLSHAVTLSTITPSGAITAIDGVTGPTACPIGDVGALPASGVDRGISIQHNLGNLGTGKKKIVKDVYRVQ